MEAAKNNGPYRSIAHKLLSMHTLHGCTNNAGCSSRLAAVSSHEQHSEAPRRGIRGRPRGFSARSERAVLSVSQDPLYLRSTTGEGTDVGPRDDVVLCASGPRPRAVRGAHRFPGNLVSPEAVALYPTDVHPYAPLNVTVTTPRI